MFIDHSRLSPEKRSANIYDRTLSNEGRVYGVDIDKRSSFGRSDGAEKKETSSSASSRLILPSPNGANRAEYSRGMALQDFTSSTDIMRISSVVVLSSCEARQETKVQRESSTIESTRETANDVPLAPEIV